MAYFLLAMSPVMAQQEDLTSIKTLEWRISAERPPGKNVLFIVDTSGSMEGEKVQDAISNVMQIAAAPLDDLQIAMVSFGSNVARWPGTTDKDPQTGRLLSLNRWSAMPSKQNLDLAEKWLQDNRDSLETLIAPAAAHAFRSCGGGEGNETVKDLSIIIISDGEFDIEGLCQKIDDLQKAREKKKLPPAYLGLFGINVPTYKEESLHKLVGELVDEKWVPTRFILGYITLKYRGEKEEED